MTDLDKCQEMFNKVNLKFELKDGMYFTQLRIAVAPWFTVSFMFQDGNFVKLGVTADE